MILLFIAGMEDLLPCKGLKDGIFEVLKLFFRICLIVAFLDQKDMLVLIDEGQLNELAFTSLSETLI